MIGHINDDMLSERCSSHFFPWMDLAMPAVSLCLRGYSGKVCLSGVHRGGVDGGNGSPHDPDVDKH